MMEEDLRTRLLAGATGAATVSWDERPKAGSLPAIVLTLISPGRDYSHDGPNALQEPRIQIDIWAASNLQARQIEAAVIALLEPPATVAGTAFGPAFLNGSPSMPPETLDGGIKVFRRAPDFSIWWQPA